MYPKLCRSLPFLDNSDQHYIVPALKRCVELLVNLCRSIVTYLYIARGPITLLLYTNYFIRYRYTVDVDIDKDYSSIEYTDNQQIN
jgi:hypothetical protein